MASEYERFWENKSFVFVGHSAKAPFPQTSYKELKKSGRKVFAVDPSTEMIGDDKAYNDISALPGGVDAAVLEVPAEETAAWVRKAADAGIKNVWIHMNRDTPEALEIAGEKNLNVLTGTCAVMYVKKGFSYHSIHRGIMKLMKKY